LGCGGSVRAGVECVHQLAARGCGECSIHADRLQCQHRFSSAITGNDQLADESL
jgi:hypothetical protein